MVELRRNTSALNYPPSPEHMARLAIANAHANIGQPAAMCGAINASGRRCIELPIPQSEQQRCIRHAGVKAQKAYRERQRVLYERGKYPKELWEWQEAKRARNRQTHIWRKKSAWVPGSTIDLASYEQGFMDHLFGFGIDPDCLAPGTMNWLRWRYKRAVADLNQPARFDKVLENELPIRIEDAGPKPPAESMIWQIKTECHRARGYVVKPPKPGSKRLYDNGRPAPGPCQRGATTRRRAEEVALAVGNLSHDVEERNEKLVKLMAKHGTELMPMLAKCKHDADQLELLGAFARVADNPGCKDALKVWQVTYARLIGGR